MNSKVTLGIEFRVGWGTTDVYYYKLNVKDEHLYFKERRGEAYMIRNAILKLKLAASSLFIHVLICPFQLSIEAISLAKLLYI